MYPSHADINRERDLQSSQNTFDEPFEMIPRRSKTIVDVNLSTDEVRERIMHIMVRI